MNQQNNTSLDSMPVEATLERTYGGSSKEVDYAQQLISMLEKKNRSLSILWPLILIAALALAMGMFMQSQQNSLIQRDLDAAQKEVEDHSSTLATQKTELDQLRARQDELAAALLKSLQTPHAWLNADNDAVLSQINVMSPATPPMMMLGLIDQILARADKTYEVQSAEISRQQAEMLKLETEASNSKVAYKALQDRVKEQTSELTSTMEKIDTLAANRDKNLENIQQQLEAFKQENVRLQKEVNQRDEAFDALAKRYKSTQQQSRDLADQLASKERSQKVIEQKLRQAESASQQSATQYAELQQSYNTLKGKYDSLNKSLKAITQPITPKPASNSSSSNRPATSGSVQTPPAETSPGGQIVYPDAKLK